MVRLAQCCWGGGPIAQLSVMETSKPVFYQGRFTIEGPD